MSMGHTIQMKLLLFLWVLWKTNLLCSFLCPPIFVNFRWNNDNYSILLGKEVKWKKCLKQFYWNKVIAQAITLALIDAKKKRKKKLMFKSYKVFYKYSRGFFPLHTLCSNPQIFSRFAHCKLVPNPSIGKNTPYAIQ